MIEALCTVLSRFKTEIVPLTLDLILHLSKAFNQIAGTVIETKAEEAFTTCALQAIQSMIEKIVMNSIYWETFNKPGCIDPMIANYEGLVRISFVLSPLFDYCLSEKRFIYFENAIRILAFLLYHTPDNSMPHLYYLVKKYCALVLGESQGIKRFRRVTNSRYYGYSVLCVNDALACIGNFIQKYKGQTLENLPCILEMAFNLLKRDDDEEVVSGCKIIIYILENYKFVLDSYLPKILSEISIVFADTKSDRLKYRCSKVIILALWNSTQLTLSAEPLVSSALQYSFEYSQIVYENPYTTLQLIHGYWSLFLVIPQLPQNVLSILPIAMKHIFALLNNTILPRSKT